MTTVLHSGRAYVVRYDEFEAQSVAHSHVERIFGSVEDARAFVLGRHDPSVAGRIETTRVVECDTDGILTAAFHIEEWDTGDGLRILGIECGDGWISDYVPLRPVPDGLTARMLGLIPDI